MHRRLSSSSRRRVTKVGDVRTRALSHECNEISLRTFSPAATWSAGLVVVPIGACRERIASASSIRGCQPPQFTRCAEDGCCPTASLNGGGGTWKVTWAGETWDEMGIWYRVMRVAWGTLCSRKAELCQLLWDTANSYGVRTHGDVRVADEDRRHPYGVGETRQNSHMGISQDTAGW
jgi:hypothetical protein